MTRESAGEYKIGSPDPGFMVAIRLFGAGIGLFGLCFSGFTMSAYAQQRVTAITCSNSSSGTTWEIKVDYSRGTVDANPAQISAAEISWHDATDGGNYTLDRKSGKLTAVFPSSTGGYFLFHRCKLDN